MDEAQLQRNRIAPRLGSTRSLPPLLFDGNVGLPSTVWNRPVPLDAIQPILIAQSRANSLSNCSANCSAIGERKSSPTVVRAGLSLTFSVTAPERKRSIVSNDLGISMNVSTKGNPAATFWKI